MNSFYTKFKNLTISRKILVWLLLLIILPILFIELISYQLNAVTIKKQTGDLIRANLELSASNVENFFSEYDSLIQTIYTDTTYAENLDPINLWDSSRYDTAVHTISENLQKITYVNRDLLGIAVVGKNGDICFYDRVSDSSFRSFCFNHQKIDEDSPVDRAWRQQGTVYSKTYHKTHSEYGSMDYFYIAHQLTDFNNYQKGPAGVLLLCVDENSLRQVYHSEDIPYGTTFIVNKKGDVISFPDDKRLDDNIFQKTGIKPDEKSIKEAAVCYIGKIQTLNSGSLEVNLKSIADRQFYIVNVQNMKYALKNANFIAIIIVLIGVLTVILCILISMCFSEDTDRSVKQILHAMDAANRGDRKVRIETAGKDEFSSIAGHFNVMMDEIVNSEAQEKEALIREKHAEIKSLEAQINPHFLYNTLECINWTAIEQDDYTISRMLTSLADIMRYSIHESNEMVRIEDELKYLREYIYLQQQRFEYSFICTVEADEEILSCRIHKLLIQPLVENVFVHAFPGPTGEDEVNIVISRMKGNYLKIIVRDNGKGMDPSLAEFFNHLDYRREKIESSIGVRNVITRVKLYYGDKGFFHVKTDGSGTCIELRIPEDSA